MNKKAEFVEAVRGLAAQLPDLNKRHLAVALALGVMEDSLPEDTFQAAHRLVGLIQRMHRDVPAG